MSTHINGTKVLVINAEDSSAPDYITLNGKKYYPEYVPEEGEVGEIGIINYSVGVNEFPKGEFMSTDLNNYYIKHTTWVPKPT
jgi:hypothetical protein